MLIYLYILHTGYGYLRFYPGIENLILPMLHNPGCHVSDYIGCIGSHAHGRQSKKKGQRSGSDTIKHHT